MDKVADYLETLKKQYTKLVQRVEKAEQWFDSPKRTQAEKEKFINEFNKILDQIVVLADQLNQYGELKDSDTVLNGYKEYRNG